MYFLIGFFAGAALGYLAQALMRANGRTRAEDNEQSDIFNQPHGM